MYGLASLLDRLGGTECLPVFLHYSMLSDHIQQRLTLHQRYWLSYWIWSSVSLLCYDFCDHCLPKFRGNSTPWGALALQPDVQPPYNLRLSLSFCQWLNILQFKLLSFCLLGFQTWIFIFPSALAYIIIRNLCLISFKQVSLFSMVLPRINQVTPFSLSAFYHTLTPTFNFNSSIPCTRRNLAFYIPLVW